MKKTRKTTKKSPPTTNSNAQPPVNPADPTPTPTPDPNKPKRPRGTINKKYLAELKNSRAVAAAAVDPNNTAGLAAVDFDATLPAQIVALANATETAIGKLTGAHATKTVLEAQEQAALEALVAVIAPIQTAARRKYTATQIDMRHAYFVGEGLADGTLYQVQVAAIAIRDRLVPGPTAQAVDTLPGVKAPQITALVNAVALYASNLVAPGTQQNQNEGALNVIATNIVTLAEQRHAVQLAAEQAFPWRNAGVASIRTAFLLPGDRPLPG